MTAAAPATRDPAPFDGTVRRVLTECLDAVPPRRHLDAAEWALLEAVNARLLPQPGRRHPIPITPWIDAMLFDDRCEDTRHPAIPPMRAAWRMGLAALADEAQRRHHRAFAALTLADQDALLQTVAADRVASPLWRAVAPGYARHFFVHYLLKTAAGIYYAHPQAWNEIGDGAPASPRGYVRLGLDARDRSETTPTP